MSNSKTITQFLSEEYKDFSLYTIENRAIPSMIDGLKPSQRKIIHIASDIWKTGNEKHMKIFQLAGSVASGAFYHHGDASLQNAIINMAQSFKNNLPLLEEDGQFGSIRSPEAGAPRYIGTRLSKNFRLLYKDFDLLNYKEEEGDKIEPQYFLPIIPTILINGSSGIAVGFASNILNRNPLEVLLNCENIIKDKKVNIIKPYVPGFTGTYAQDPINSKRWIIRGSFINHNTSTIKITELPPSMTYERYEIILDDLVEKKIILSYEDNCKDNVDYVIKFTREFLSKLDDDKIYKLLKLEESQTEIFTTLDENGKLKIFESPSEMISYFVKFRLEYYNKRKEFMLNKMKHDLKVLLNRGKFIKAIIENKIEIKNKLKSDIIIDIEKLKLEKIDNDYDYLLRMPIWSLTKEMYEKLKLDYSEKKIEIEKLSLIDPKDMYLDDLSELKKKLKN